MLKKKDIQDYRGYLPLKWWADDTVKWIGRLVGGSWLDQVHINIYSHKSHTRFRFGDIQEAQVYLKNGEYHHIPLRLWYLFSELDPIALDDECQKWIQEKRREFNAAEPERPKSFRKSDQKGSVLDL